MRAFLLLACCGTLVSLCSCLAPNGDFGTWAPAYTNYNDVGSGTAGDPFQVFTAAQLQSLANTVSAWSSDYQLMNNIDMAGAQFSQPIGNSTNPFSGSFEGQNYKISNLQVSSTNSDYVGAFGNVSGTIDNLIFDHITFGPNAATYVGIIALNSGTISGVHVRHSIVQGGSDVGGLIGVNNGSVIACGIDGTTVHGVAKVGGLVGVLSGGSTTALISQSATGTGVTVSGQSNFGGLLGEMDGSSDIQESYSEATIKGVGGSISNEGGLVGQLSANSSSGISDSYSAATVSVGPSGVATNVGGLIGNFSSGTVTNTYAANQIYAPSATSVTAVGGLVGSMASISTLKNSFAAQTQIIIPAGTPDPLVGVTTVGASALSYLNTMSCSPSCGNNLSTSIAPPESLGVYSSDGFASASPPIPSSSVWSEQSAGGPWLFSGGLPELPLTQP